MSGERTLPGLGLRGFHTERSNGWGTPLSEDLRQVSAVAQLTVKSRTTALPDPGTAGDIYIVPSADATNPNKVALWDGPSGSEAWVYISPQDGWMAFVQDEDLNYQFNGSVWAELETGFDDAPLDGTPYARQNGTWVAVTSGGSAPSLITSTPGVWEPYAAHVRPPNPNDFPVMIDGTRPTITVDQNEMHVIGNAGDDSVFAKAVTNFNSVTVRMGNFNSGASFDDPGIALVSETGDYIVFCLGTENNGDPNLRFLRYNADGTYNDTYGADFIVDDRIMWLNVTRTGDRVHAYYSTDGIAWTEFNADAPISDIGADITHIGFRAHRDTDAYYYFYRDNEDEYEVPITGPIQIVATHDYTTQNSNGAYSSSSYNAKGNVVRAARDRYLTKVTANLENGQSLFCRVAEVGSSAPYTVTKLIAASDTITTTANEFREFLFDTPVLLEQGKAYAILIVATDDAAVGIPFPNADTGGDPYGDFDYLSSCRFNAPSPDYVQVGDDTYYATPTVEFTLTTYSPAEVGAFVGTTQKQQSTDYTVQSLDFNGGIYLNIGDAADITITVPSGLGGSEPLVIERTGAGAVTFAAGSGVTINSRDGLQSIASQYGAATLVPKGNDTYTLIGDLA